MLISGSAGDGAIFIGVDVHFRVDGNNEISTMLPKSKYSSAWDIRVLSRHCNICGHVGSSEAMHSGCSD